MGSRTIPPHPGQLPSGQLTPGQLAPGHLPPGQLPPRTIAPWAILVENSLFHGYFLFLFHGPII